VNTRPVARSSMATQSPRVDALWAIQSYAGIATIASLA
jgi:hypothetical protein